MAEETDNSDGLVMMMVIMMMMTITLMMTMVKSV